MISIKSHRGFTLIELFITVTMLGLLLAVALPRLSALSSWQLESAARKMAVDLRLTRNEAVSSGKVCQVKFFVYGQLYQLHLAGENRMVNLPEGISFQGSTTFDKDPLNPYVLFNALGRPNRGGTVILKSANGDKRYIIVTPVTGRVRVSREPPQNW